MQGRQLLLRWSGIAALVSLMSAGGVAATAGAAPAGGVVAQGDQVLRGEREYRNACAFCHGTNLEGADGPPLVGGGRLAAYGTAARLFTYTRGSMPQDAPGGLSDTQYYDIIAYMLDFNSLLPAGQPVNATSAADISLRN